MTTDEFLKSVASDIELAKTLGTINDPEVLLEIQARMMLHGQASGGS